MKIALLAKLNVGDFVIQRKNDVNTLKNKLDYYY